MARLALILPGVTTQKPALRLRWTAQRGATSPIQVRTRASPLPRALTLTPSPRRHTRSVRQVCISPKAAKRLALRRSLDISLKARG